MGHKSGTTRTKPEKFMIVDKLLDMRVYDLTQNAEFPSLHQYFSSRGKNYNYNYLCHYTAAGPREEMRPTGPRKRIMDFVRDSLTIYEKRKNKFLWEREKPVIVISSYEENASGQWLSVMAKSEAQDIFFIQDKERTLGDIPVYNPYTVERMTVKQFVAVYTQKIDEKKQLYRQIARQTKMALGDAKTPIVLIMTAVNSEELSFASCPSNKAETAFARHTARIWRQRQNKPAA
jgi:hypothetical protein